MKRADIYGRAVQTECGEEGLHDYRRCGNDQPADNGKLPGIGVTAPDGETTANNANGAEDKPDEHDDSHRLARALGEAATGLSEDGDKVMSEENAFHVHAVLPREETHAAPGSERIGGARGGRLR